MGIPKGTAGLLLHESRSRPFQGRILTLGRQHIYVTERELRAVAAKFGVGLSNAPVVLHRDPLLAKRGYLADDSFFQLLGFDQVERADVSDYEDVDHLIDLNSGELPESLCEKFDVILDTGTLEHVFHVPNALRAMNQAVKPGGRVIHLNPTANMVEHGFYCFSPTFYMDYYAVNACVIHAVYLVRSQRNLERAVFDVYEYQSARRRLLTGGRLDRRIYLTWCVVEKQELSTTQEIPQQGAYLSTWSAAGASPSTGDARASEADSVSLATPTSITFIIKCVKAIPGMRSLVKSAGTMLLDRSWRPTPLDRVGRF